jgi:hypothetical protein
MKEEERSEGFERRPQIPLKDLPRDEYEIVARGRGHRPRPRMREDNQKGDHLKEKKDKRRDPNQNCRRDRK